jgi:secondary thiamine-phosphate synthase enzyme
MWQAQSVLAIETAGQGFTDMTVKIADWLDESGAGTGLVTLFLRHTSASLTIQENADPDVLRDLNDALDRLAPEHAGYRHATEGPDDMPAHIKAMLTSVSLTVPVDRGAMLLGTWQGIYLVEHRATPHRRHVVLTYQGSAREGR